MAGLARTAALLGVIWIMVATASFAVAGSGEQRTIRVDLYDLRSNRIGYVIVDQKTGRVDAYDTRSNRTSYGVIRQGSMLDVYDSSGRRVGSGELKR